MIDREQNAIRLGFWVVLLLSVFAWAPTTYPGYWESLEGFRPVFNAVRTSAISGVATNADLWRGSGSATYLIAQPLMLLGVEPVVAVRVTFAIAIVLGGLGMYVWLAARWGDRAAGLSGLLYMLWPPLLATVYIRGSLSDAMILGLLPLAFAGAAIYSERRAPSAAAVIAISLFWMWRTQAGLALLSSVLLLLYSLLSERNRITALIVALSAGAGFTSLLPHWSIRSAATVLFADHFVYPHQLLVGNWQVAPSQPGWQDGYPFMLGFAVLAFGVVALWLRLTQEVNRHDPARTKQFVFGVIASMLLILLVLPISAPLWAITGADRIFTYPWQVILVTGPLLAFIAGSLPYSAPELAKPPLWIVLVCLTILSSFSYLTTDFTQVAPPQQPVAIFGDANEIVLLDATIVEVADRQTVELTVTWQALNTLPLDYNVFFQAIAPEDDKDRIIAQIDTQPLQDQQPATRWLPGDIYTSTYTLNFADAEQSPAVSDSEQPLRYYFGFYDWRNGSRLPVDGGIDDKVVFYGE